MLLTACGGSKNVVTQDDSAEYRTAKTLPPLRKPSAVKSVSKPVSVPTPQAPSQAATPVEVSPSNITLKVRQRLIWRPPR